jgi:hypothetical protein
MRWQSAFAPYPNGSPVLFFASFFSRKRKKGKKTKRNLCDALAKSVRALPQQFTCAFLFFFLFAEKKEGKRTKRNLCGMLAKSVRALHRRRMAVFLWFFLSVKKKEPRAWRHGEQRGKTKYKPNLLLSSGL